MLENAYYQALRYKKKGEYPSPKEFSREVENLMKGKPYVYSEELYAAVKRGPKKIPKREQRLFSDAGYRKKYSASEWRQMLEHHTSIVAMCYERFGGWYAGGLSLVGYVYQGVMYDQEHNPDWDCPFWADVEDYVVTKHIHCHKNFLQALWSLEDEEELRVREEKVTL